MDGLLVIIAVSAFIFIGFIKSLINTNKIQKRKSQKALEKSPKYISEQKERREKELAYIKETLDKCRKNPDINIAIYNDEAWQIHWDRLNTYGRSMHSGEMYYKGQRGGIYTLSANGSRNYKY